jgi:hypothetical protein
VKPITTRQRNALVLAGVLALSALGVWLFAPVPREHKPIDAIPDGAFMLATVDLVKLRESPLGGELASLQDVSQVAQMCGFDPLLRATQLAVGIPEKPDGVFGVALTTHDLAEDELVHCAERVMSARSAMPHVVKRGSWTEIEQEGVIALATRPRIAFRQGSPLLVGRGDYLATMQATLDGDHLRAKDAPDHAALRKAMLERSPDALLVVTGILPKAVRERIAGQEGTPNATMSAILAVTSFGLSLTSQATIVDVVAKLECETEAACATVKDFVDRKVKGTLLAGLIRAEAHEAKLDLTLTAPEADIVRAIRALLSAAEPERPEGLPHKTERPPPKPDEILRVRDAGP